MFVSPALEDMMTNVKPARLGILASGGGSNFEVIVEAVNRGGILGEVAQLICNNPGAGVLERAQRLGVETTLIDHRGFATRSSFDHAVVECLRENQVDWVVMAGWMRVSTATLIDAFPERIINLHPSLLPSFKGQHAVADAIAAGVKISGCTVHLVRLEVDAGPIIAQAVVPCLLEDTVNTLHPRIHAAEHAVFPKAIAHVIAQSS